MEKWQADASLEVRLTAAAAAAMSGLKISLQDSDDPESLRPLLILAYQLHQASWKLVKHDHLGSYQYAQALSLAKATQAFLPLVPKQFLPQFQRTGAILGIGYYRNRQWQEAIKELKAAETAHGETPVTLAYLALAYRESGDQAGAQEMREKLKQLMSKDDWKHDADSQAALQEVNRVFDSP